MTRPIALVKPTNSYKCDTAIIDLFHVLVLVVRVNLAAEQPGVFEPRGVPADKAVVAVHDVAVCRVLHVLVLEGVDGVVDAGQVLRQLLPASHQRLELIDFLFHLKFLKKWPNTKKKLVISNQP